MVAYTGTGALTTGAATLSAVTDSGFMATAALTAPLPVVAGTGVRHITGTGDLETPSMQITATTSVPDPTIWETDNQEWGAADFIYSQSKPVMLIGNEFYQADAGLRFGETSLRVVMSRTGLTIIGRDRFGQWKSDPSSMKECTGIWPLIRGVPGTVVRVYIGAQDSSEDPVRWEGPYNYTCGTTQYMDFTVTGRYLGVRFESQDQEPWELLSYDLELEIVGERG
jgi:hypothetical protein